MRHRSLAQAGLWACCRCGSGAIWVQPAVFRFGLEIFRRQVVILCPGPKGEVVMTHLVAWHIVGPRLMCYLHRDLAQIDKQRKGDSLTQLDS